MEGKRAELILDYSKSRESLVRLSFLLTIAFLAIASLSLVRTSAQGFKLALPLLKDFVVNGGDLVVFGPLAIFVMTIWFDRRWFDCIGTRAAILRSYSSDTPFSEIENYLLRAPFAARPKNTHLKWFVNIPPRFLYCWALANIVLLLNEYFDFRKNNDDSSTLTDVIIGSPPFSGFDPKWGRFPELNVVWIYPPWYPICYSAMIAFLLWRIWSPPATR